MNQNRITIALVLVQLFVGSLTENTDVKCLRAIKSSLEDPNGYLKMSWNFDNKTEGFICKFVGVECWHPDESKVLNLRLPGLGLAGHFPTGVQYCTSLTGLDLSGNSITGTIPTEVANLMPFVTSLDLSYNDFSGEIPATIANISYLNVLRLDHNRLTGNLPAGLDEMERLKEFSVAHNLLSGKVPSFTRNTNIITRESLTDNPDLCGAPLEPCVPEPKDPFKLAFGIGFAVSFFVAVFVSSRGYSPRSARSKAVSVHLPVSEQIQIEIPGMEQMVHRISFAELFTATENFSNKTVIGTGETGSMHKATLHTGQYVAVKKLHDSELFESLFVSELLALGKLKHKNIVPLFGFCSERNERLLVYKYMPNGSLHDWLRDSARGVLQWPTRLKIALGAAGGLSWLHHGSEFRVVHCSISSRCVLLDHRFEPKLSNFGRAIVSNHSAEENGSGDSIESGVKKDVYDYGVVLLEMLVSGKRTQECSGSGSGQEDQVIDKSLAGKGLEAEIIELLGIANECVHEVPSQRPTMIQVYKRIRCIGERYEIIQYDHSPIDYFDNLVI